MATLERFETLGQGIYRAHDVARPTSKRMVRRAARLVNARKRVRRVLVLKGLI